MGHLHKIQPIFFFKLAKMIMKLRFSSPVKKLPLILIAFIFLLTTLAGSHSLLADIQAPPQSDDGPTRKLGRGLGNILYGPTELIDSMSDVNASEGNSAAFSYGLVRGLGRSFARLGYGVFETLTFPFPTNHGTYKPPYGNNIQWLNSGYSEFPPELGFETKYDYSRQYSSQSW